MKNPLKTTVLFFLLGSLLSYSVMAQISRDIKNPALTVEKTSVTVETKAIAYITVDATKQGKFKGNVQGSQKSEIIDFNYSVSQPYDQASGMATGKLKHGALTITMKNGPSTPQFLQALSTNEVLKSVFIEFTRTQPDGTGFVYYTVKLINAHITRINQVTNRNETVPKQGGLPLDEISFVFQRIEMEQKDGNTMTVIDAGNL